MAVLSILQFPDPRLKRIARPVETLDDRIQTIIDDMFETHYQQENCAALAATQLDMDDPPAITVIDFSPNKDEPLCLINPTIVNRTGEQFETEGCMSVGLHTTRPHEKVKRAMHITVEALDRKGQLQQYDVSGFMAKCMQHEIDHLGGIIYLDRLSPLRRKRLLAKLPLA